MALVFTHEVRSSLPLPSWRRFSCAERRLRVPQGCRCVVGVMAIWAAGENIASPGCQLLQHPCQRAFEYDRHHNFTCGLFKSWLSRSPAYGGAYLAFRRLTSASTPKSLRPPSSPSRLSAYCSGSTTHFMRTIRYYCEQRCWPERRYWRARDVSRPECRRPPEFSAAVPAQIKA